MGLGDGPPARTGQSTSIMIGLSTRKSIRALLYCLGFLGTIIFLATIFEGPRRVSASLYKPLQHLMGHEESIIDTNKVYPLTKPSKKATPFPPAFNPLSESAPLAPGPWTAHFPDIVATNQPFRLRIECTHEDLDHCPPSYNIQFYGPTATSVPITAFTKVAPRIVEAAMVLYEQGDYQVYAWPAYPNCTTAKLPKLQSVGGTPHVLNAQQGPFPVGRDKHDVHRTCKSHEEVLDGRWINHDLIKSSIKSTYSYGEFHPPQAAAIAEEYSLPINSANHSRYVYSPYGCKIPHRSFPDVVNEVPALDHVVFIGGPIAQGYVCSRAFPDLFGGGGGDEGVCEQHPETPLLLLEHGNRAATRTYSGHQEGRSVDVTFVLYMGGKPVRRHLDKLRAPQVVVFDVGDFADDDDDNDDEFVAHHKAALDYFDERWKGVHVLVRSAASVVQPIRCFTDSGGRHHTRASAWRKRGLTLAAIQDWLEERKKAQASKMDDLELDDSESTRVSFIDAYTITDLRPETSLDGYHWMYPSSSSTSLAERPTVGEADDMVLDWMWDEIVSGRSMAAAAV